MGGELPVGAVEAVILVVEPGSRSLSGDLLAGRCSGQVDSGGLHLLARGTETRVSGDWSGYSALAVVVQAK